MRYTMIFLLAFLLPLAAAQPGPAPGYGSAIEYAQAYAEEEAGNASADPAGYAKSHATPEALQGEANHTLYIACWAADDVDVQSDACDPYYTPRGEAQPEQPHEPVLNDTVGNTTAEALDQTDAFKDNVTENVEGIVDDPENAPVFIKRIVGGAVVFATYLVGAVVLLGQAAIDAVAGALGAIGVLSAGLGGGLVSLGAAAAGGLVAGIAALVAGTGSIASAAADGFVAGIVAAAEGLAAAAVATGKGIAAAAVATGKGVAAAATAVAGGVAKASSATWDGIATAGKAIGEAVVDAAKAVKDAVGGLFGADGGQTAVEGAKDTLDDTVDADGLLDTVGDVLP